MSDRANYFDTDSWFCQTMSETENVSERQFVVTDFGVVCDSTKVQTSALQAVIDQAAEHGGTVVVPEGTFLSGALFFRPGTHLKIEPGGRLKGSDDIADFPVVDTRI
ncbi:MAG: exopolygalacturonase, partial [Alistipes sp.]|nr:exopolygalacturonase [Alistipes sp.]